MERVCSMHDLPVGLRSGLLESTDWKGRLPDRILAEDDGQRGTIAPAVNATIDKVKSNVFPIFGLAP